MDATDVEFGEAPFEIIDGDRGKNYPKQSDFLDSGHCLFLSATNVTKTGFDFADCQFIDEKKDAALNNGKLKREDIVLTTRGTIGNTAYFNDTVPFENLRINSGMVIFRCDCEKMLPAFLYHFLRSPSFHGQVNSLRSGVAQPQLPIRDMRRIKLPLPSLPVQQRIAAVLSAYDGLIENNQRRIQILESMARAIYRQRFVGAANSTFGALCELVKEPFDESEHSDRPLLDLARMPQRTIAPAETGKASELTTSRILFEPGDTLFGAIRCYLHKVLAAHFPGVTNTSVLVLRPKKPSFRSLVALIASDSDTIRWADTHSTGAKMPVINWGVFQTMPAPLPSESAAQEFENVARPMLEQIGILANQIQNLRRTRDLLLPRLLSGQVNLAEN